MLFIDYQLLPVFSQFFIHTRVSTKWLWISIDPERTLIATDFNKTIKCAHVQRSIEMRKKSNNWSTKNEKKKSSSANCFNENSWVSTEIDKFKPLRHFFIVCLLISTSICHNWIDAIFAFFFTLTFKNQQIHWNTRNNPTNGFNWFIFEKFPRSLRIDLGTAAIRLF